MQVPPGTRIWSECFLPEKKTQWSRIGVVVLGASLLVNLASLTMNVRQYDILVQLSSREASLGARAAVDVGLRPALDIGIGHLVDADDQGPRRLESSSSATDNGCGSASGEHASHQTDALLYLFGAFLIGTAVMQLSARFPMLQQTVLLFIVGFIVSLFLKGLNLKDKMGIWGRSYDMWIEIDPHLLLFTLLPALLAGDAMTIDTSVARRVALQCLYLAGPGVLICGFGTAAFLHAFLGWEFKLSLCAGAILCATDPVAVVALLKELGASPMLTIQIQGESLLNDGTAIVLYLISYNMMKGEDYDVADIAEFLVKKCMMAWALGLFIGYFFFSWIRAVADKLDHSSSTIQITLTLCCAYWSFIFVEGVLELSGVLACVASSLVLAHHMWPYIVSEESMQHVWHTFESLGNTIVFFLAGSITGNIVLDIDPLDILNLIVIYIFLLFIRGALLFASRPVLKVLSADKQEVSWQDAALMTWGGLRGAVGLALAIQVKNDRADGKISQKEGDRLLFFVSGIAFLTIILNSSTAPALVSFLDITAPPQARLEMLKMFNEQLICWSQDSSYPDEVTEALKLVLDEATECFKKKHTSTNGPKSTRDSGIMTASTNLTMFRKGGLSKTTLFENNKDIATEIRALQDWYRAAPNEQKQLLGTEMQENLLCQVDDIIDLVQAQWVDLGMAKVVNRTFLTLVLRNYWKLIEDGDLRPGSPEADALLASIRMSLSPYQADLRDYEYVHTIMGKDPEFKDAVDPTRTSMMSDFTEMDSQKMEKLSKMNSQEMAELSKISGYSLSKTRGDLKETVSSWQFGAVVSVAILLNSLQVLAEEIWRDPDKSINDNHIWLVLDLLFTIFFFLEFAMKFGCMGCVYFSNWWNRFDFCLVLFGIVGCVASILTHGKESQNLSGQTRIIRIARVLRTLRFLRIFRLFHAKLSADKYVSPDLARHLKKVVALDCFIRAHIRAQIDIVKYYGGNDKIDTPSEAELGRCILQSQIATYKALQDAAATQQQLGDVIYTELQNLHKKKAITENLSKFVLAAHHDGALSASETHAILHPLYHQIAVCMHDWNDRTEGVLTRPRSVIMRPDRSGTIESAEVLEYGEPVEEPWHLWPSKASNASKASKAAKKKQASSPQSMSEESTSHVSPLPIGACE